MAVDLKNIKPELKRKMEMAQRAWVAHKLDIIITQGYRTPEYQNSLYAQGRTKPGKIVTNATGKTSLHCQGKAFDIAFIKDKKVYYPPLRDKIWKEAGAIGVLCGLTWGGNWTIKKEGIVDYPHFQIN